VEEKRPPFFDGESAASGGTADEAGNLAPEPEYFSPLDRIASFGLLSADTLDFYTDQFVQPREGRSLDRLLVAAAPGHLDESFHRFCRCAL
jgi:hypothetical protein